MRNIIAHSPPHFTLVKTTAVAAFAALAVSAAPAFAADNSKTTSQNKAEDMAVYEGQTRVPANNDIFWMTTEEIVGQTVITRQGETVGTIEKIVIDPRENRGEAIVAKSDGGMFVLPLDRFWLHNDQVAVAWSLSPSDLQYLTSVYKTESSEGYWKDAPVDDTLLGTLVYTGDKDYIEQMVTKQGQQ